MIQTKRMNWSAAEDRMVRDGMASNLRDDVISVKMQQAGFDRTAGAIGKRRAALAVLGTYASERPQTIMPPSVGRSIDELIEARLDEYERKKEHHQAKKDGIPIIMPTGEPYALCFFGDPHVDDAGSSLAALVNDAKVVKDTPGCVAINMGDLTNNWCQPLARLYGVQETTTDEAESLMGWLLDLLPWQVVVLGNHDKWDRTAERLCKDRGIAYVSHGALFKVMAGESLCIVDARHTHRGNSMYNASHAQLKQNFRGSGANIIVGAHTHVSAYTMVYNGTSRQLGHCIRVGSYKVYDEYADANGFEPDTIGPFCMAVVDTSKSEGDPGFINVFWDAQHGCDYLTWLRSNK